MEAVSVLSRIERAHQMYRDGKHQESLDLYTEALAMAKTKAQKISLHRNRVACSLKLHDFKKVEFDGKQIHLPLNLEILKWSKETREIFSRAKVPTSVNFYNIYGTHFEMPQSIRYKTQHQKEVHMSPFALSERKKGGENQKHRNIVEFVGVPSFQASNIGAGVSSRCRRVYAHAHDYNIHYILNNWDSETFISADDLRINLWNMEISNQCFNIIDIKPLDMEDLVGDLFSESESSKGSMVFTIIW